MWSNRCAHYLQLQHPKSECQALHLPSNSLIMSLAKDDSDVWALDSHVGDQDGAPGSWFLPDLLCLCPSVCLSLSQCLCICVCICVYVSSSLCWSAFQIIFKNCSLRSKKYELATRHHYSLKFTVSYYFTCLYVSELIL